MTLIARAALEEIVAEGGRLLERPDPSPQALALFAGFAMGICHRALEAEAKVRAIIREQANDEGLWFVSARVGGRSAAEEYLQQALRRLHAAVEGEP